MIYGWHAASGSDHGLWALRTTGAGDRTTARKSVDQTLTGLRAFRSKGFRLAAEFESYRPRALAVKLFNSCDSFPSGNGPVDVAN
jgi:hypothetical protein